MSFPGDWPGKCIPEAPPGCFWTTQQPATGYDGYSLPIQPMISWEHRYLDCDCQLTGKCAVGEPPPPPTAEFLGNTEGWYPDDLDGPYAFPESNIDSYEYHHPQWHSPFVIGPGPNAQPAPHGPALKKRGQWTEWAEWKEAGADIIKELSKIMIDEMFKSGRKLHSKAKGAFGAATDEKGKHVLSRYKQPMNEDAKTSASSVADDVREQHHA